MDQVALKKNYPHYDGHRKRLKTKFLNGDSSSFDDYELLELLLFFCIPRRDVKPLAKELLKIFGTLGGLLNAPSNKLKTVDGVNENICILFLLMNSLLTRVLRTNVVNHNILSSWDALLDYLKLSIGFKALEEFHVLFLNKKNILLADEVMSVGTIDQTFVYPREILKRALFHEAAAIILVHNHPSSVAKPSKADVDLTNAIIETCKAIGIAVHDHVIISKNEYFSFKTNMLL